VDPVRGTQNRNAWPDARLAAQLDAPTVRSRHKRFASGPLPGIERGAAAPPTLMAAQRLLLQSEQVQAELALAPSVAGPGTV
jgi:hypothetical protein